MDWGSMENVSSMSWHLQLYFWVCKNEWLKEGVNEWRQPWYLGLLSMHKVETQRKQAANCEYANGDVLSGDQYGSQTARKSQRAVEMRARIIWTTTGVETAQDKP